ncbi:hypothetical protein NDU88_000176 [Pleurodeles waltl]|uniref:Uncharacterized protein n=1 Tax=Pleurodeles waltl TaxID=8319 RepID=A0AAV7UQ13_PLEWA|nr:hypothetical protein NDU88_000176 [Pleurodeles waltl]
MARRRSFSKAVAAKYVSKRSTHSFHRAARADGGPSMTKGSNTGIDDIITPSTQKKVTAGAKYRGNLDKGQRPEYRIYCPATPQKAQSKRCTKIQQNTKEDSAPQRRKHEHTAGQRRPNSPLNKQEKASPRCKRTQHKAPERSRGPKQIRSEERLGKRCWAPQVVLTTTAASPGSVLHTAAPKQRQTRSRQRPPGSVRRGPCSGLQAASDAVALATTKHSSSAPQEQSNAPPGTKKRNEAREAKETHEGAKETTLVANLSCEKRAAEAPSSKQ